MSGIFTKGICAREKSYDKAAARLKLSATPFFARIGICPECMPDTSGTCARCVQMLPCIWAVPYNSLIQSGQFTSSLYALQRL